MFKDTVQKKLGETVIYKSGKRQKSVKPEKNYLLQAAKRTKGIRPVQQLSN
ncbi:hypothetical protein BpJC7_17380 [Weizmannia acidilactici]|uniref:Uncharacterized protein n=1 Tax=Weizmannia acidilactici TaxID=2607726 RepID=A0A5J4JIC3_9BACI|nr:hypothetical protein BpJC4_00240 [Weizmannia acidilactici]GER70435.1 hypothetical protein BpJC7_17380 [Weizmannia acidilactici]GER74093.1 hypothetical protein BpPP18_21600 [Weizmannia acidilactici]